MVRLSLVNLYLHGFADPHIVEYDTLTQDDKWNELADVILANPPFMSPKGGIKPHKRFSVQATRSEVLFVDYMAEHLTATGRAAIVVPEGIIFQSGTAYKALRKMLVESCLVAVVSLPAGVFNPYSGVKTSILILDKRVHKQTDRVLFVKVQNDGFNLGAQRRAVANSDLPEAARLLRSWITAPQAFEGDGAMAQAVARYRIGEGRDFSLSGERYLVTAQNDSSFAMKKIGDVFTTSAGGTPLRSKPEFYEGGTIPWLKSGEVAQGYIYKAEEFITESGLHNSSAKLFPVNTVLVAMYGATAGQVGILKFEASTNQAVCGILPNAQVVPEYLYFVLKSKRDYLINLSSGGAQPNISQAVVRDLEFPLPPLEIQQQIVAEIDGYQKVIDGARQVLDGYKPHIAISPDWQLRDLGSICENLDSKRAPVTKSDRVEGAYPYYGASGIVDYVEGYIFDEPLLLISEDGANLLARSTPIAFSVEGKVWVNNHAHVLRFADRATQRFVELYINSIDIAGYVTGSAQPKLNQAALSSIQIPLPDLPTQRTIVAEIEAEQALVNANRELIHRMEAKIKAAIDRVWGNEAPPAGADPAPAVVDTETPESQTAEVMP